MAATAAKARPEGLRPRLGGLWLSFPAHLEVAVARAVVIARQGGVEYELARVKAFRSRRLGRSSPRQGADIGADQVKQSRLMTT
jgi:hypothetical protein